MIRTRGLWIKSLKLQPLGHHVTMCICVLVRMFECLYARVNGCITRVFLRALLFFVLALVFFFLLLLLFLSVFIRSLLTTSLLFWLVCLLRAWFSLTIFLFLLDEIKVYQPCIFLSGFSSYIVIHCHTDPPLQNVIIVHLIDILVTLCYFTEKSLLSGSGPAASDHS